ncbi:RICIN domain-containing protein [Streptacidiphilus albus]|uniref:RICIN domain-containing protein n=1 Tax=Streptacidiphilus albus TaxID=105425 RepID=UPI0005AB1FB2|nr:RICIN domain-containing protein [Streptacidiphilus albus]
MSTTPVRRRLVGGLAAFALATVGVSALTAAPASATASSPSYSISVGSTGSFGNPDDTPAGPFIDKDGTFYYQSSHSLYGATDSRSWNFYTGTNFDTATADSTLDNAVNPANSQDSNSNTTYRCNNSPTGLTATYAPSSTSYAEANYCDLAGVWVDPDTGYWYGMVHNEFTPQPFGDGLHFDAIDYAVSTDQGRLWTIENHAITSPYSTTRGNTTAFPNETYDYGDGDPRLYTDTASGYFYLYYGSRIVDKTGSWAAFYEHVARAPISGKMAPGTWEKWYDGSWSQPGQGGLESNLVPVSSSNSTGYTPASSEYNPDTTGTASQQIAAGEMPATSPLFVMDITYDAYLGLYIGEPQNPDQSGSAPQQYYATSNLATQQWSLIGDTGSSFETASWYRWFLDSTNLTSSAIVGKSFRSYCAYGCPGGSSGDYANVTVGSSAPAAAPFNPADTYRIASADGQVLGQVSGSSATASQSASSGSTLQAWSFVADGDGSYRVVNASSGQLLGVGSSSTATRAWGTAPTVTASGTGGPTVGQQWWIISDTDPGTGAATGSYRLVNRYSGLVIGLTTGSGAVAETTPARYWTNTTGNSVGGSRTGNEQTLTMTAVGTTTANLNGTHTVSLSGQALDDPNWSTSTGVQLDTWGRNAGANQNWVFTQQSDGSYQIENAYSDLCLDDDGGFTTAGTEAIQWTCTGGSNQHWTLAQLPGGAYTITNVHSGLLLTTASTANGALVTQQANTGSALQQWTVQ